MMETRQGGPHELLPWYVNATLDIEETAAVEEHLPGCASCREELGILRSLSDAVRRHREDFFLPHPDSGRLVTELLEGLPEPEGAVVRRHLALCSTCAVEARLVREGGFVARSGTAIRPADRRRAAAWAAAAAILIAVSIALWPRPRWGPRPTDVVQAHYVEPTRRDLGATLLRVPADVPGFQIVLPVEVTPESLPLSIEILDGAGRTVFARRDVIAVYRDSFIFVFCDRREFPDGEYLARVRPAAIAGEAPPAPLEFRFRVAGD